MGGKHGGKMGAYVSGGMNAMNMNPMGMMMAKMAGPQDGASMMGVVKNADPTKGYGFIMCPLVPGDIYFKTEEPLMQGQQVGFTLKFQRDGKPHARDVKPALQGGEILV